MYRSILIFLTFFTGSARGQVATVPGTLNNATIFTVEFWVKTTESRSDNIYWQRPYLFGNETNGNNSGDFGITTNNGYIGMWEGLSSNNTDQVFLSPYVRINDNQWHHIAVVNNGQLLSLYVDGNVTGSLNAGRPLRTSNAPLTFGAASLDHIQPGNTAANINFSSQALFGEARISNIARYAANFSPSQFYSTDLNTVSLYHFGSQDQVYNNNSNNTNNNQPINIDPNRPVVFDPGQAINDNYAQPAILYFNDSIGMAGRLLMGKKNWSLSNEIGIHFFEGDSKKAKFYKPEEIKGFRMGNSYYESKFLSSAAGRKTMVKRLTQASSKIAMYEYEVQTSIKNPNGYTEYKTNVSYFIQLPGTTDDKVYAFSDNKFVPHFDKRVADLVQDKPALADKIRSKDKDFFYAFITEDKHQLRVWWNIINEYNKP